MTRVPSPHKLLPHRARCSVDVPAPASPGSVWLFVIIIIPHQHSKARLVPAALLQFSSKFPVFVVSPRVIFESNIHEYEEEGSHLQPSSRQ